MAIYSKKLKFLDITNYLAAGTSLSKFTHLPDIEEFRSILTKKIISPEDHQLCKDMWRREGMETFGDFVRHYNNGDVIRFVEAMEKIVANEKANKLNIFKSRSVCLN